MNFLTLLTERELKIMNPYLFWLIVAILVLFFQMLSKIINLKHQVDFWKDNAMIATEKYNQLLVKKSMTKAIQRLERIATKAQ